ncbi:MAG: polyprenol phosphomannose-dependent alpha 1,6 mannosyltransferase MptB [Acidimicrobiales bacterium]
MTVIAPRVLSGALDVVRRGGKIARTGSDVLVDAADRASLRLEVAKARILPSWVQGKRSLPEDENPDDWRFLRRPALLGFVALVAVAAGASLPSSPFKLEMAGTWFFGEPPGNVASQHNVLLGLVAVYGGLVLLMRVWYGMMKALARRPGVPMRYLGWILVLWLIPMLVVAPIFSRDVFSYAAQGEMMSRHINPYRYGPGTLGVGPYPNPVDPLWINTPAPYGPLFLMIDGFLASASLHHEIYTVVLLRLFAVAGVVLTAWCIPKLARAYKRDVGPVFVLAVLNPLVVLTLVGAAHNDAIMMGLLVAGITAAKCKHPVWGVVLCALAVAIKVPAALGLIYIGWEWMGPGVPWRQRVRPLVTTALVSGAIMLVLSAVSGLGLGWIGNLATPGTVRSWLAPATGIGMEITSMLHVLGLHVSQGGVLSVTRVIGLMGAAVASLYLLLISDRIGGLRALGVSLLLFVILGPVVQPWYLTWGIIMVAPIVSGRLRSAVIALSIVSPFIGLPGGRTLLGQLIHANPLAVAAVLLVLLGVLLTPLGQWSTSWRYDSGGVGTASMTAVLSAGRTSGGMHGRTDTPVGATFSQGMNGSRGAYGNLFPGGAGSET